MAPHASIRVSLCWRLIFCVVLLAALSVVKSSSFSVLREKNTACPCVNASLCLPVNITREKEIIVFSLDNDTLGPNWRYYDWAHITTIIYYRNNNPVDPQLVCYAHSKGVRVVEAASFSKATMSNETLREKWIASEVNRAVGNHLDGINLDVELTLTKAEAPLVTTMVQLTTDAFHKAIPTSKVSFDAPYLAWSGSRPYEYDKIAAILDYMIIMAYDMPYAYKVPSNTASSHDAYSRMVEGIGSFFARNIPPSKMALAVPWYGYNFKCTNLTQNICYLDYADCFECDPPRRSSAEIRYKAIMDLLRYNATSALMWNNTCEAVYFSYKDQASGDVHQIWFENPASLAIRYYFAKVVNLMGVAMWTADHLDYSNDTVARQQTKEMWDAIAKFVEPF